MSIKLTFLQFIKEQGQAENISTSVETMDSQELRRLSSMDAQKRSAEMARKKRREQTETQSPTLRNLLKQKEMIEQKIAAEKAKLQQQGQGGA